MKIHVASCTLKFSFLFFCFCQPHYPHFSWAEQRISKAALWGFAKGKNFLVKDFNLF